MDSDAKIEIDELNLEDLLVLGDETTIPISISFPRKDGTLVRAKAHVKQLTLKEVKNLKLTDKNYYESALNILQKTLFKSDETNYSKDELLLLPVGVLKALIDKIFELSGFTEDDKKLLDF